MPNLAIRGNFALDKTPFIVYIHNNTIFILKKAMTKRSTHHPLKERAAAGCPRWEAA